MNVLNRLMLIGGQEIVNCAEGREASFKLMDRSVRYGRECSASAVYIMVSLNRGESSCDYRLSRPQVSASRNTGQHKARFPLPEFATRVHGPS